MQFALAARGWRIEPWEETAQMEAPVVSANYFGSCLASKHERFFNALPGFLESTALLFLQPAFCLDR